MRGGPYDQLSRAQLVVLLDRVGDDVVDPVEAIELLEHVDGVVRQILAEARGEPGERVA